MTDPTAQPAASPEQPAPPPREAPPPPDREAGISAERGRELVTERDAARAELDATRAELQLATQLLHIERQRVAILTDACATYEDAAKIVARTTNVHVATLAALNAQEQALVGQAEPKQASAQPVASRRRRG